MVFGKRRKVDVELQLDRDAYRPGDTIGITAVVHGDEVSGVAGGEVLLRCRAERRWVDRNRDLADLADGELMALIPTEKRDVDFHELKAPLVLDGTTAAGAVRLSGSLDLPDDAPPSSSVKDASVEWNLSAFVKR